MSEFALSILAQAARERIIGFCQRLVREPSLTGDEGRVAALLTSELHALGLEADTDRAGNVIGRLRGRGGGRSAMLHAHMDIVDPGDPTVWRYGPYAGVVEEGFLWGRGAVDDKGSLAAQVYALGLLREAGLLPAGDVWLAGAVGEEVGGIGTRYLARALHPSVAVIGEPSHNTLRRGHRGRFEWVITFRGRSAHASVPHEGRNPHPSLARFVLALQRAPMVRDAVFGDSTAVPTLVRADQTSSNVIPAELTLHVDWRNAPAESPAQAQALIERLLAECTEPGIEAQVALRTQTVQSYTGYAETIQHCVTPFVLAPDDPLLLRAQDAVEQAVGHAVPVEVWPFFTDGGHLFGQGVPCLGYGPGLETLAHVLDERLPVEQLLEATAGYMALALALTEEG